MKEFLKMHKNVCKMIITLICLLLIVSILNYFGLLGSISSSIINMLIGAFMLFWLGFNRGQKRENKGYIGGLIAGILTVIILFVASVLILKVKINFMMLIYYGILILSSTLGSMLGINKKRPE